MLKLTFHLKKSSDTVMELRLSWGFRFVFLVLFALIVGSIYIQVQDGAAESISLFSYILLGAFSLAAVYDERWIFDCHRGVVVQAHGLLFLHKRSEYRSEEISHLEITEFRKGSIREDEKRRFFQRDLLRLSLVLKEAGFKDIEITEKKNMAALQSKAATLADFMNFSYHSFE